MEEFLEADVLWPESPPPEPPWGDRELYLPELHEATDATAGADFSCESFGSDMSGPAASSSSSSAASSALAFGGGSSDDSFLSHQSTFAGGHGGDDASFQEADVLWPEPDDGYATRERDLDGGELWWLCCGFGADAAAGSSAESSAGGKRGPWKQAALVSSPIDIPTAAAATAAAAARRRRRAGATSTRMGMDGLSQAHW